MDDVKNNAWPIAFVVLLIVAGIVASILVPVYLVTSSNTRRMEACSKIDGSWVQNANKKYECRTGTVR